MDRWYVRRGEKIVGPLDAVKLKGLAADGRLLPTDLLAKDPAGPWTDASRTKLFAKKKIVEPPRELSPIDLPASPEFVPTAELVPAPRRTDEVATQSPPKSPIHIISVVGRGFVTTILVVSGSFSGWLKRRHEIKLATIQAKGSQVAGASGASNPIVFAPQTNQTTVVKIINRNSGCGCSGCGGCGLLLLLLLVACLVMSFVANSGKSPKNPEQVSEPVKQ